MKRLSTQCMNEIENKQTETEKKGKTAASANT